jgi:predicted ATPase/DNA-binding CsgD family transcriptional regulator/DNA-binding XRE family transcriptional regulator
VHVPSLMHPVEPVTPARLVACRRALGLTQRALGDVLGVQRNTVARWERGDLRVARPDLLALALARLEARTRPRWGRTVDSNRSSVREGAHLPAELTSFVGREAEVAECVALLTRRRLVTLTGPGGIGKSRLAAQVARGVANDFPHGVYLVDLSTLEDPVLVPRTVSTALGIAFGADGAITDLLIEALQGQKVLLLMDDCDGLVRECGQLAYELLRGAPGLAILATCREPLDVVGETAWRVQGLKTPASEAGFDEIASSEAVQLFVERVPAVARWFKLTEASAPGIADLCRRLDGIPLALELAAARMKALTVDQLIARLEPGLQILTSGSRTAPSRQQTLRATVDFSYRLLSENERVLFRRLSVFAGGWTVEAAERVTAGEPLAPGDTLRLLERLIDKSLVVCEERNGTARHSMLETLREYAHERLVEADEEDQVRRRHFEWVLDVVESIDPDELSPSGIERLRLEVQNLRSALGWSIDASEAELALRLVTVTSKIWNYAGFYAEGIRWVERTLGLPRAMDLPQLRGLALKWLGALRYGLGDMRAARGAVSQGCAQLAGTADWWQPPLCAQLLGNIARASGDLPNALRLYQQALSEYGELQLAFWEGVTLFLMAWVLFEQGDYAGSRATCERCLARSHERKFTWATSRVQVILAYLAQREGDDVGAERLAQKALAQLRALVQPSGITIALRALSQFALERGRLGRAWSYLAETLEIANVMGDRMALASTLETVACVLASQAPSQAAQIAGAASILRARTGSVPLPSEQARLTRWLGVARRRIGERAFQADWTVGETLSDAEAISAARRFVAEALGSPAATAAMAPADGSLTARQREVAGLVARGLTNEQIAQELVISPATARAHVEHVLDRLDLHSRAQVAAWAAAHGLVTTLRNDSGDPQ